MFWVANGGAQVLVVVFDDSELKFAVYGHQVNAAIVRLGVSEGNADWVKFAFIPTFDFDDLKHFKFWYHVF